MEEAYGESDEHGDTVLKEWLMDPEKFNRLKFTIIDGAHRWYLLSSVLRDA